MRKNIHYLLLLVVSCALLFTLQMCADEYKDPYTQWNDIQLFVEGEYAEICGGDTIFAPAAAADIFVVYKNRATSKIDTINGKLGFDGKFNISIPESKSGISKLQLVANHLSFVYTDSIDFMCCDTSFVFLFERNCMEINETVVQCESIDTTFNLNLTNQYGGNLMVGAKQTEIRWNNLSLSSTDNIVIDVKNAINLNGKFSANISPSPDANGNVQLGAGMQNLSISFFVKTDEAGVFENAFELQTTCTNEVGDTQNGSIKINLSAEISDDGCACPFSSNNITQVDIDKSNIYVLAGSTRTYSQHEVMRITESMIEETCYLKVVDIKRLSSTVLVSDNGNNPGIYHAWTLDMPTLPIRLDRGNTFNLTALFTPESSGLFKDSFLVNLEVYNSIDEMKETCSFQVSWIGTGCENRCPEILVTGDTPARLFDQTGTLIKNLSSGSIVPMSNDDVIDQTMNGVMGNLCTSWIGGEEAVAYQIRLPEMPGVITCSSVSLSASIVDDGQMGDRNSFISTISNSLVSENIPSLLSIRFKTPDVMQHILSGHPEIYKAKIVIEVSDNQGRFICNQEIKIEAQVHENSVQLSKSMMMKSFSQISDKESRPTYQAYKIDAYNKDYKDYGEINNLSPVLGHVNVTTVPPTPTTSHSFYFDVDEPVNASLLQTPKLYLVNNELNRYSRITSLPVANYSNNDSFESDLPNLVNEVFKPSFLSRGNAPINSFAFNNTNQVMWNPSSSAAQLAGLANGLSLKLGDVFIIWDPDGTSDAFDSGGKTYSSYCNVAFLYIDGIHNGAGTTHNIGYVSFYVAYPLNIIKE